MIALAALACLLLYPLWLTDVGFQLSFLAVLALTQSERVAGLLPGRWPRWLRLGLAATLLAEAGTLPVIAGTFGQVPLVGLPANLLAGGSWPCSSRWGSWRGCWDRWPCR